MKARDIQLKHLIAIIGASAVAIASLGVVAVDEISDLTRDRVHTEALDRAALRAKEIEGFFAERGRVVTTLFANPTILGWFAAYNEYRRPLEGDKTCQEILAFFNAVIDDDPTIPAVFLSTESTGEYFRPEGRVERPGYDPKQRWWWIEALEKDRLYVSPAGIDAGTGQVLVTVQTTIYLEDGRLLGVGGADVLLGSLGNLVEEFTYQGVGNAFLVDSAGKIVYFPELQPEFDPDDLTIITQLDEIDDLFPDTDRFQELAEVIRRRHQGLQQVRWQGEERIVVHVPVRAQQPELDWTLGLMVPEQLITSVVVRTRLMAAVAILVAVAIIASLTVVVAQRINARLLAEDRRQAEMLREANLKLLAADRMKSQFLANMSHELRTPLNSIIGFSEILRSRLHDQLDHRLRRFLDHIHTSGEHLLSMISDILDLSKVEAGRMDLHPERLSVSDTIEGVCSIVQAMARERKISLHVGVPPDLPRIEADPVRFKQILFNLVSNAVKFSHEDSVVKVLAQGLSETESPLGVPSVAISVIDTGIGISPEDQELIFEEFRQADGTKSRLHGGTGLGLALVKRLVELHLGSVTVDSTVGEGSTFTVTVPQLFMGPESEPIVIEPATPLPQRIGNLVLVVEDDHEAWERIRRDLASAGYRAVCSRDGSDAVDLACRLSPAAVVLDLVLPAADGLDILRQLKSREDTCRIPIIIVSVLANHELGLTLGADAYFVKPVERERFLSRLRELAPAEGPTEPRVLLIDDDPKLHDMLHELMEAAGYVLDHAHSGAEGLQAARTSVPHLIILDLMMEGMDGFEVAGLLKKDAITREIPIVVFTARQETRVDRERLRGKIEALVEKGTGGTAELVPLIRDLLSRC